MATVTRTDTYTIGCADQAEKDAWVGWLTNVHSCDDGPDWQSCDHTVDGSLTIVVTIEHAADPDVEVPDA